MTKKSPTIVFFGNERLSTAFEPQGAPTLEALIAHGYHIAAVISHYEPGRSRKARSLEIEAVATSHNIPVLLPEKLTDISEELASYHADCGVLVAYGKMVPQSIIDLFPRGIVNIHPSLLPQYRGSIPIEQAILDGAEQTGVSIMALVKAMDAGPVYAQITLHLQGDESKLALTQELLAKGGSLLIESLPHILDGSLQPAPQDERRATYTTLLTKQDGVLDWRKPAADLTREVRAFAGWPQSKGAIRLTSGKEMEVIVTKATVADVRLQPGKVEVHGTHLLVGTTKGALQILRLKVPGKKEIAADDFIRGYLN